MGNHLWQSSRCKNARWFRNRKSEVSASREGIELQRPAKSPPATREQGTVKSCRERPAKSPTAEYGPLGRRQLARHPRRCLTLPQQRLSNLDTKPPPFAFGTRSKERLIKIDGTLPVPKSNVSGTADSTSIAAKLLRGMRSVRHCCRK